MKPKAWSPTKIDTFANCPRQFYGKYVSGEFAEDENDKSAEQKWGIFVHKQFEDRLGVNTPLPKELSAHNPFMDEMAALPGTLFTERKVTMDKKLRPCSWYEREAFFRAILDLTVVDAPKAVIVDYKTGKPHKKMRQLIICSLWTFAAYPNVEEIDAKYYWTVNMTTTGDTFYRRDTDKLWGTLAGDLQQYKEAYHTDIWQPRPSGLCNGWCPDTKCDHWRPKREKR